MLCAVKLAKQDLSTRRSHRAFRHQSERSMRQASLINARKKETMRETNGKQKENKEQKDYWKLPWTKKTCTRINKAARKLAALFEEMEKCESTDVASLSRRLKNAVGDLDEIANRFAELPSDVKPLWNWGSRSIKVKVGDQILIAEKAREKLKTLLDADELAATYEVVAIGKRTRVRSKKGNNLFLARREFVKLDK